MTATPFTATVTGSPRIGPKRELKRATESYWAGRTSRSELEKVAATLRHDTWAQLAAAGLDSVPVNTFSYYDQMLDTAVLLGALPERVQAVSDDLDRYFAAARGTGDIAPLEMTKWFDTNYHYIVPEIGPKTTFSLHPEKVLSELKEAQDQGIPARPVVIGPVTFLLLSKAVDGAGAPIERLDELVPLYTDLLGQLADAGAEWVQIDEPVLVTDISADAPALAEKVYNTLGALDKRPAIHVATYFGDPGEGLAALARTPIEAIGVDFVYGPDTAVASVPELADKTLVAGVVDGRNIWRTDLESALSKLASLLGPAGAVAVSTSCSTLHVPYSLEPETDLDDALRSWLAFGAEKVHEVATLAKALKDGRDAVADEIAQSNAAVASRKKDPRLNNSKVRERLESIAKSGGSERGPAAERREAQNERLHLPPLPTTTIGSFPQTVEIRKARAALVAGEIDEAEYTTPDAVRDRRRDQAAGGAGPGRAGARRAGAQRHGAVLRRATGRLLRHQERLGAVLRQPLRASAGAVRRRDPPAPDDGRVGQVRAVADRQAGQGHAHRSGDDPGVVVRPRRPAAGRHRQPGGAGDPRRDGGPAVGRYRGDPGRRARTARAVAAARLRQAGLPGLGGRRVPAGDVGCGGLDADPHAPVLLGVR